MKFFTIGYGGRAPSEFVEMLQRHGIRTVADIRLRPRQASMGCYVLAKSPDKGIQALLGRAGFGYSWVQELGNPFLGDEGWQTRYRDWIQVEGELRCRKLFELQEPVCLMCSEKRVADCHRLDVANVLVQQGHELVAHL